MSTIRDLAEEALGEVQDLRELVRSGGYPYIKITLVEPERGGVTIEHQGLAEDVDLAAALQELALLIADAEEEPA